MRIEDMLIIIYGLIGLGFSHGAWIRGKDSGFTLISRLVDSFMWMFLWPSMLSYLWIIGGEKSLEECLRELYDEIEGEYEKEIEEEDEE